MHAQNDTTLSGPDLHAVLKRILPRGRLPAWHPLIIGPSHSGWVILGWNGTIESIEARGTWHDVVETSATFLRALMARQAPPTVRLVFYGQALAVNGTTISATTTLEAMAPPLTPPRKPLRPPLEGLPLFDYSRRARPGRQGR